MQYLVIDQNCVVFCSYIPDRQAAAGQPARCSDAWQGAEDCSCDRRGNPSGLQLQYEGEK